MKPKSFNTFTPIRKLYFTNNIVIYSLLYSLGLIWFLIDKIFPNSNNENIKFVIFLLIVLIVLYGCYYLLFGGSYYKVLKGKIEGILVLDKEYISVGYNKYKLVDINTIDLNVFDYYGNSCSEIRVDFNPRLSNGVNNVFTLQLKSGILIKVQFQQLYSNEFLEAREHLIVYHLKGIISIIKLRRILGIYNYEDVKKFDCELKTYQEKLQI